MSRKLLAILLFSLFLGFLISSNTFAVKNISLPNSEVQKVKICLNNQDSSIELSIEEAEQIKNKFLDIEKNFIGAEKIRKQLEIMYEIGALPSDFSLEFLYSIMEKLNNSKDPLFWFQRPHFILGGPMIVSHFTLGGRIQGINTLKPWYYNETIHELKDLFNGSYLDQAVGVMPIYIGVSLKPVFITTIGFNILKSVKDLYFPFIEILILCAGTSIAFMYVAMNSEPIVLFEYNIDVCLAGFLGGL